MAFKIPSRRILVIKTRAIGDTVLLTGVLRVLREKKPYYKIDVLVRNPGGQLLECLPCVDRVICINEPKSAFDRATYWMRLVRRLREKRYEMVLNFHASVRTSFFAKMLRTEMVVVNNHDLKGRNWFSDLKVPGRGQVKSIIERDLDLLRAIGISSKASEAMPELRLNSLEEKEAEEKLSAMPKDKPRVFLGIGASRETKRWDPKHYATSAAELAKARDANFVIVTTKGDDAWMKTLHSELEKHAILKNRIHSFKNMKLRDVGAVLSRCDLYFGNDSGMKHIAAAYGLPTFTIFGPELPTEWHPYDITKHPYAFITGMACRTEGGKHWCSIPVCTKHAHKCMTETLPSQVVSKAIDLLDSAK